jgi:hypothetical protein
MEYSTLPGQHGRCNLWGTGLGRPLKEAAVRIARA